jgi:tripartite-type tricarboxylate transporter receptor subunit TctC
MRKAFFGLAIAFSAFTGVALAQPYPLRPVTLIVQFGAGGPRSRNGGP